jgi:predicted Zn-dependent peptidase
MIKKEVLSNGLTVITENMPNVRSISLGVWLKKGSRHEKINENGISHFIEHLLFKGTESKSVQQIALIIDSIGGQIDAFTSKEYTCFYAKVLDEHFPIALELLSDIVLHPKFDAEDIEKERKVIFEEIRMVEDTPDELVYDIFIENFWKGHSLGKPIQGTVKNIAGITGRKLLNHFKKSYSSENLLIVAAGRLNHQRIVSMVEEKFQDLPLHNSRIRVKPPKPHFSIIKKEKKELGQVHLCLGMEVLPKNINERFQLMVLNDVLGGSMSSRLFQKIREEKGLVYSIFASVNSFIDAGFEMVYAATNPRSVKEVVQLIVQELVNLKEQHVSEEELKVAKDHLKGNLMLCLENTSSRMSNIARHEIYFARHFTLSEMLKGINSVTAEKIQDLSRRIFVDNRLALSALGKVSNVHFSQKELSF